LSVSENGGKKLSTVSASVGNRGGGEENVGGKTASMNDPKCRVKASGRPEGKEGEDGD